MEEIKNLNQLIGEMAPKLNLGKYVFTTTQHPDLIDPNVIICSFKEGKETSIILEKRKADELSLNYNYISAWITLTVNSSLHAVGLTAAFSSALAENNISCNVVAGFYHDHIFVDYEDSDKAMRVLKNLSESSKNR